MTRWTKEQMPEQTGRIALITGANSGIGYETALALAERGAHVILACRNLDKGREARDRIARQVHGAALELAELDLSRLDSVRVFAAQVSATYQRLDLLINNAGVMAIPRQLTQDGFEMQFAVNHLAHFALTGLLLDKLLAAPGSRVVTISSLMHDGGTIRFDDLTGERHYDAYSAYSQSKLANLLFAYELQRRLSTSGASTLSVACHPGFSATNLFSVQATTLAERVQGALTALGSQVIGQSAAMGALPTLYAATAPAVNGCNYIGPRSFFGMRGAPGKVRSNALSYDPGLARHLWDVSEDLTGVRYKLHAAAAASADRPRG